MSYFTNPSRALSTVALLLASPAAVAGAQGAPMRVRPVAAVAEPAAERPAQAAAPRATPAPRPRAVRQLAVATVTPRAAVAAPMTAAPARDTVAPRDSAHAAEPATATHRVDTLYIASTPHVDTVYMAPAPAATAPATPAPVKPAAPAAPAAFQIGTGTLKFSGSMSAWHVSGGDDVTSTFRLRRVELRFVGDISKRAKWTLMFDPSKTLKVADNRVNNASLILQDAFITLQARRLTLDVGQMRLPLGYEGRVASSSKLETIERAQFSSGQLAFVRDVGAMVSGPLSSDITFSAGVFNATGEGQNGTDVNDRKAAMGRLELKTALPGLALGASGAWTGPVTSHNVRHDRLGGEAVYLRGPLTARAEYMRGWDALDVRTGWYGLAGWTIRDVQLVGRYDVWDRDGSAGTSGVRTIEHDVVSGMTYALPGTSVRLQSNYVVRLVDGQPRRNTLLFAMQAAW